MSKLSAGLLLYRIKNNVPQVLLVHPGGPFWANKDLGAWSIPKGEFTDEENALDAAKREFKEETGMEITGDFIELTPVKQKSGKLVHAWLIKSDLDFTQIKSNSFELKWPPKSGTNKQFPEIDKAQWFGIAEAKEKMNPAQVKLIEEMEKLISSGIK